MEKLGSAKPIGQSCTAVCFLNEVLLEHRHTHFFSYAMAACIWVVMTELQQSQWKSQNLKYLSPDLYKKKQNHVDL